MVVPVWCQKDLFTRSVVVVGRGIGCLPCHFLERAGLLLRKGEIWSCAHLLCDSNQMLDLQKVDSFLVSYCVISSKPAKVELETGVRVS